MAKYWLSYLEIVEVLFMNYHALRSQNWEEYLLSLRLMLPWMAVYDQINYTRYMTLYWADMMNLTDEQREFMKNGMFCASISGRPFSGLPFDQWKEMTMNKGSKMKSGWVGFTKNESMLYTHTETISKIESTRQALHAATNIKRKNFRHSENSPVNLTIDEEHVQDKSCCIQEWNCDPFDEQHKNLQSFESGLLASPILVENFSSAYKEGEIQVQSFLKKDFFIREADIRHNKEKRSLQFHHTKEATRHSLWKPDENKCHGKQSNVLSQCQNPVIIDSEDTDVVAIAAHAAHELPGQMLLYQKGHLFDCHQMCSSELASVLVQLHAFTGADAISGFFGLGKVSVLEKVKKTPEFASLISDLGLQVELCPHLMQTLTQFTINCICRDVSSQSLAEARSSKWLSMKKKSTERLPPDED
eukprot:gene6688-7444_t